MRKLRNTLYITDELCYLFRDGTNIIVKVDDKVKGRFPIHILEQIVCFNYNGASPSVVQLCNENNVSIAYISPSGHYMGRFIGKTNGNVLLRREQYRIADSEGRSLPFVRNILLSKVTNSRKILRRAISDNPELIDQNLFTDSIAYLTTSIENILSSTSIESLRGYEGDSARTYFSCFNSLILKQTEDFIFAGRSKRPPLDRVNALLSFGYSILANEVQSALEVVGLDSFVGFLHTDRPGRPSLALDLMEELRAYLVDRFVLRLINLKSISSRDFEIKENKAVLLNDDGRKKFISHWQERKQEIIRHPFLDESFQKGLLPYAQAQLLARTIRGDINEYPPFFI